MTERQFISKAATFIVAIPIMVFAAVFTYAMVFEGGSARLAPVALTATIVCAALGAVHVVRSEYR